jgi:NAD-dependent dihydropyrimidine dehydrogenase PreA subunit
MDEKQIYQGLIDHIREGFFGLPDSDLLMPLMKMRFTPEEAAFLSRFPHLPHTLEQLSEGLGIPSGELRARMASMIRKGFIYESEGRSAVTYFFTDAIFLFGRMPGWKGEKDLWNRQISPLINRYYTQHLSADFLGHPTKGLRAIPIAKTVKDTRSVAPYEDVLQYVEQEDYHTVSTCACRHTVGLDPETPECAHETLNCLHFGRLGRYIVKHDMGKEISREETLDILAQAADAGLVHGISNSMRGMDTICNCCPCCCIFLRPGPHPVCRGHQASNYIATIRPETCKGCGRCVERCPMDALRLEPSDQAKNKTGKVAVLDPDQCLGCGVCAHKCPTQSVILVPRETEQDIPGSMREAAMRFLKERDRKIAFPT